MVYGTFFPQHIISNMHRIKKFASALKVMIYNNYNVIIIIIKTHLTSSLTYINRALDYFPMFCYITFICSKATFFSRTNNGCIAGMRVQIIYPGKNIIFTRVPIMTSLFYSKFFYALIHSYCISLKEVLLCYFF